jgi:hypothetical protein
MGYQGDDSRAFSLRNAGRNTEILQTADVDLTNPRLPQLKITIAVSLHALRHREEVRKTAFPPQGAGTPFISLTQPESLLRLSHRNSL